MAIDPDNFEARYKQARIRLQHLSHLFVRDMPRDPDGWKWDADDTRRLKAVKGVDQAVGQFTRAWTAYVKALGGQSDPADGPDPDR